MRYDIMMEQIYVVANTVSKQVYHVFPTCWKICFAIVFQAACF